MTLRRVSLRLPENPSGDLIAFARAVQAALRASFQVRITYAEDVYDPDKTPADMALPLPLVLHIEDPNAPDGADRTM